MIDLSASEEELVDQVKNACQRWGFFQITAHEVDDELRNRFESMMRAFFALPEEDKMQCERSADNARGFVREEMTKQKLDNKQCFDMGNARDWNSEDDGVVNQGSNAPL